MTGTFAPNLYAKVHGHKLVEYLTAKICLGGTYGIFQQLHVEVLSHTTLYEEIHG